MNLTIRQKKNLGHTVFWGVVIVILALTGWGASIVLSSPSQAANTPPVPQVNAQRYEQLNFTNDPQMDHYCIASEGYYFSASNGDLLKILPGDPLCP